MTISLPVSSDLFGSCLTVYKESSHERSFPAYLLVLQGNIYSKPACAASEILFAAGLSEGEQAGQPGALVAQAGEPGLFLRCPAGGSGPTVAQRASRILAAQQEPEGPTVTRLVALQDLVRSPTSMAFIGFLAGQTGDALQETVATAFWNMHSRGQAIMGVESVIETKGTAYASVKTCVVSGTIAAG